MIGVAMGSELVSKVSWKTIMIETLKLLKNKQVSSVAKTVLAQLHGRSFTLSNSMDCVAHVLGIGKAASAPKPRQSATNAGNANSIEVFEWLAEATERERSMEFIDPMLDENGLSMLINLFYSHADHRDQKCRKSVMDGLMHSVLYGVQRLDMELAQVACRDQLGQVRCFPLVQTHQRDQVCDWVVYPAPVPHAVEAYARNVAMSLVTSLTYVGVMGIEFFYGPRGLMVNEVAPRVHNSGHLTLEACRTNQFAQQVRIVAGLPMGLTEPHAKGALMVNLLGYASAESAEAQAGYQQQREALEAMDGATLHWYGKVPRLGRKLGHVTFLLHAEGHEQREAECARRLQDVRAVWPWPEEMGSDKRGMDAVKPLHTP